ncbi:hypothetical protein OG440_00910 [Streptomyces sp. NBC_00637]|uniref:MmcQ/YjbR family DNA-binding protein n=1 Tax=Streptomyces sp. NBC_00637 TaxID=2903667 RepID=UPI0032486AEE
MARSHRQGGSRRRPCGQCASRHRGRRRAARATARHHKQPPLEQGWRLQQQYPPITAGRHLDKTHWISLGGGRGITAALVEDRVTDSYDLALDSTPRSRRPARP